MALCTIDILQHTVLHQEFVTPDDALFYAQCNYSVRSAENSSNAGLKFMSCYIVRAKESLARWGK